MNLLAWREKHIDEKSFVVMLALVVGIASGLAAVLLKFLIGWIGALVESTTAWTEIHYQYLIFPLVGILLASLYVRYLVRDNISHGVTRVLYAIALKKSRLKVKNMYASLVASSMTIGFGGSVGAEGPIVFTGAAIGSNLGQAFRLSPHTLMLLVGCGAAAGIAGIFKAPIAGLLFTVEVLMLDLTAGSAIPLIVASVTGATVSYIFTGYNVEFFFSQSEPFFTSRIPFVILLGIFCGFVSLYFSKMIEKIEGIFGCIKHPRHKFILGGLLLSTLIFLFPPLFGEGYGSINNLLNGDAASLLDNSLFESFKDNVWYVLAFIFMCGAMKAIATSATNGGGGVGGTFAPSLYVGCMAGFFFAYFLNSLGWMAAVNQELRPHGHGRCDGRCDARTTYGHLPYGRDDWWLRSVLAAAHSLGCILCHLPHLHSLWHLHSPFGTAWPAAHSPEGPQRAHSAQDGQRHRDRLRLGEARYEPQGYGRRHI